jgi:hypothetical protein
MTPATGSTRKASRHQWGGGVHRSPGKFFRWASSLTLRRSDDVAPVDCTTR